MPDISALVEEQTLTKEGNLSVASLAPGGSRTAKCTACFPFLVQIMESRILVCWPCIVTGGGYLLSQLQKTLRVQWAGRWVSVHGVSFVSLWEVNF